jgi:hypothetical protein
LNEALARVIELLDGVVWREPAHLVHLVEPLEHAFPRELHVPVEDDLEPAPHLVARRAGEAREAGGAAGLLVHLAESGRMPSLSRQELAFR